MHPSHVINNLHCLLCMLETARLQALHAHSVGLSAVHGSHSEHSGLLDLGRCERMISHETGLGVRHKSVSECGAQLAASLVPRELYGS
jgi:hypothetical protein